MEDKIYNILRSYINKTSMHLYDHEIQMLAKELNKHFHELYWQQELEYLKEDVENFIDGLNEYELTEQQMYAVADRIRNSEWYCSINPEDMEYYIKDVLERSKQ